VPIFYRIIVNRSPQLIVAALAIMVLHRLATVSWAIFPAPEPDILPPANELTLESPIAKVRARSIAEFSLFGRAELPGPVVPVEQPPVVESRLNLTLLGVFVTSTPEQGMAIIADPSGNDGFYSVGMLVPGGAVLAEVHDGYVLLKRESRIEKLSLPQDPDLAGVSFGAGSAAGGGGRVGSPALSYRPPPAALVRPDTRTNGAILRDMRQTLAEDPARVLDNMRVDPVRDGDHLVGYRLNPARDRQLLSRFGLMPGDIVTAVNGVSLNSVDKGPEIVKALSDSNQLSLEVMRNGISQKFSFKID
jgi:general secretion pathway protein C